MNQSIPQSMRALVQKEQEHAAEIKEIPVPGLDKNEVLIKVDYAAQNPTDWKHAAFLSSAGKIHGGDFAGTVVKLGPDLKVPLKVGDKIAGCTHGGTYTDRGAYAQYARIESDMAFKIPDSISEEQAATYGIAWVTACQALIDSQKQSFPPAQVPGNPWYVIYGASSSVGLFAVSLAKALGYRVLGVASSRSFDLVKSYGADDVVDYHDADKAIEDGKKITGGGVEYALDTISEGGSFKIAIGLMGDKGKQLNCILPPSDEAKQINPKIKVVSTLMYTLFGREFKFASNVIPASQHDRAFGEEIFKQTPDLITKYAVKPNPTKVRGGLDDVLAGWEEMKTGKVSGQKLVYRID